MAEPDPPLPARPGPAAAEAAASGPVDADGAAAKQQDTHFIVQSAQRNERHAWTLLSAKVLFFLRSRFGNVNLPSDIEFDDFGSEVMLRILGDIHRFTDTGKGSFWGWVYILAQNLLNDLWRRHQRRQRIGLLPLGDAGDDSDSGEQPDSRFDQMSQPNQPSPPELAHLSELEGIERDCAARLPESMCRIYLMRRERELSFDEISAEFRGVKAVTLRSYYKRSRDFVKDCIQRKLDNLGSTFGAWRF